MVTLSFFLHSSLQPLFVAERLSTFEVTLGMRVRKFMKSRVMAVSPICRTFVGFVSYRLVWQKNRANRDRLTNMGRAGSWQIDALLQSRIGCGAQVCRAFTGWPPCLD